MWAEAVDDEKLRLLAFEDRWHFVAMLCLKCKGVLNEKDPQVLHRKIAIKLGLDLLETETVMKRLVTVGLLNSRLQPVNWTKRQFKSDSSTYRVQQFRKRQRNVSETDQIQIQIQKQILKKATESPKTEDGEPEKTVSEKREDGKRVWPRVLAAIQDSSLRAAFPSESPVGKAVQRIGGWQRLGMKNRDLRGQTEQQFLNAYAEVA
jgi:hypothetical protein